MEKTLIKNRLIKLAFYKNSTSTFGRLIRLQQKLQGLPELSAQYSHAEILFCGLSAIESSAISQAGFLNNDNNKVYREHIYNNQIFFSSSESDGGVRFKEILTKSKHWDFIEVICTDDEYSAMLTEALRLNGRKYGWAGIVFAQFFSYNLLEGWMARGKRYIHKLFPTIVRKYFGHFCSETSKKVTHSGFSSAFSRVAYKSYDIFANPGQWHLEASEIFKSKK